MKPNVPALLVALCVIIFLGVTWHDQQQLPPRVVSHFDLAGHADDTMPRSASFFLALSIGLGLPVFIVAVMYLFRFFPNAGINVPHADYWRAPENYPRACDILFRMGLWFACGYLLWWTAFFHKVARANFLNPPHLDNAHLGLLTAIFFAFLACWTFVLYRSFLNVPSSK